MGRFGLVEILIILGIAILLFGGSRIAGVGKGLGEGIKNFKKGLKDEGDDDEPAKLPKSDAKSTSADVEDKSVSTKT